MTKNIFLLFFTIISISSFAQTIGAYKHDWNREMQKSQQLEEYENTAIANAIKNVQLKHKELSQLAKYDDKYKGIVKEGWQIVTASDNIKLIDNRIVYVENGKVTKYLSGEGKEIPIAAGGNIIDLKSMIVLTNGHILTLYFGIKMGN